MAAAEPVYDETVYDATLRALRAARHLTDENAGVVAAVKYLARKIDTEDELRDLVLENAGGDEKVKPPPLDNVSVPTYLKYCEALGLTPASRGALNKPAAAKEPEDELEAFKNKKGRAG